jgi:hypothetical protein
MRAPPASFAGVSGTKSCPKLGRNSGWTPPSLGPALAKIRRPLDVRTKRSAFDSHSNVLPFLRSFS